MWQSILYVIPEQFIAGANQLAMLFGYGPDDGRTFEPPNHTDAAGNRYAARFVYMPAAILDALQQPLQRPAWDTADLIDMDAAEATVAALVLTDTPVPASPSSVIVTAADAAFISAMGLTRIPDEVEIGDAAH